MTARSITRRSPLDDTLGEGVLGVWPPATKQVTIRLDVDVLHWLESQEEDCQAHINRILRVAMEGRPLPL